MSCRTGLCSGSPCSTRTPNLSVCLQLRMFSGFSCLPKTGSYESHHLTGLRVFSSAFLSQYLSLSLIFFLSGFSHDIISCNFDSPERFFYIFSFQQSASIFIHLFYNVNHGLMEMHHSIFVDSWSYLTSSSRFDGRNRHGISWDFSIQVINKGIKILKQERSLWRQKRNCRDVLSTKTPCLSDYHCIV